MDVECNNHSPTDRCFDRCTLLTDFIYLCMVVMDFVRTSSLTSFTIFSKVGCVYMLGVCILSCILQFMSIVNFLYFLHILIFRMKITAINYIVITLLCSIVLPSG